MPDASANACADIHADVGTYAGACDYADVVADAGAAEIYVDL